ncbi:MAG: hypothetical protein JW717_11130 [Marinilabiliaceae bacterium]|nr:hypothetical protein [Marinilabiliaceae bacterium]
MNRIILYILTTSILYSCIPEKKTEIHNIGNIEYKIEYPVQISEQPIANILPEEMSLFFTPNELKFKIKSDLNIFMLEYLSRANGDSCYTLFKVVNRKLYYPLYKNEQWFLFKNNPPIKYQINKDSIKNIAGIDCYQVIISTNTNKPNQINAYFTNNIKINRKLLNSPFNEIDGVPLQFEIQYYNKTYKFIATKITGSIGDEIMTVPNDYKLSTPKEINELVNSILN